MAMEEGEEGGMIKKKKIPFPVNYSIKQKFSHLFASSLEVCDYRRICSTINR